VRVACIGEFPPSLFEALARLPVCEIMRFGCAAEAMGLPREAQPGLWVTEVLLPGLSGLGLTRRLSARAGAAPVLVVTRIVGMWPLARAVKAGARGYLQLPATVEQLTLAIERLLQHGAFRVPPERSMADHRLRAWGVLDLPPRRFEALHLILQGKDDVGVAEAMSLGRSSAAGYRRELEIRLGLSSESTSESIAAAMDADFYRKRAG